MNEMTDTQNLDTYIKQVDNQEIKGILLKLKNEIRKPDVTWEALKNILVSIEEKDPECVKDILLLLIKD